MTEKDSLGLVETKYYTFAESPNEMELESGQKLGPITLAYESYGKLNKDKSNAILVAHALSGDAHAAGYHEKEKKPGWWDPMIGPGKAFDTNKYFVLCVNVIGGCRGSTGPSSINPKTGKHYGAGFPMITIGDMVEAQRHLLDHLGIKKLLSASGGSMGGMQVLQWIASYPEKLCSAIPLATSLKHSPQQIAFSEVGRHAILADPAWRGGNYYEHGQPERGLALARMIGHITYMSDQSMEEKFSRRIRNGGNRFLFDPEFEVEGYLHYRGDRFVERFDANSYLYITKALDYLDLSGDRLIPPGKKIDTRFLVVAFKSDWLYPAYQMRELVSFLKMRDVDVTYCEIPSTFGHDAFLLEFKEETHLIKNFLEKTYKGITNGKG